MTPTKHGLVSLQEGRSSVAGNRQLSRLAKKTESDRDPHGAELTITAFDRGAYLKLIEARGATISSVVRRLKPLLGLTTALDAGCGMGFFSQTLRQCGLSVGGFDARMENVLEARNRFPGIPFELGDVEDAKIAELGAFDLVLCFGLLYHLENPVLAIRHLRSLTRKGLLVESMCVPGQLGFALRHEPRQADQSLTGLALYPTESGLVKMLYGVGFPVVYRVTALPDHDDFQETPEHARRRTVLFASATPIELDGFERIAEPEEERDPWARRSGMPATPRLPNRLRRFLAKTRKAKYISLARKLQMVFPSMPVPVRLPFGAWWLAEHSTLDSALMYGQFEEAEMAFVEKILQPGMTALDAGAHHGLYTLLMSRRVGPQGKVIAFEPSPRERRRLQRHLRLNRCANVRVKSFALGDTAGEADLFLVAGREDWCNSLRPPEVEERTTKIRVEVQRVDEALEALGVKQVDFIKLDVEGAELSFLRGACGILCGPSRPAILAEVQDIRTRPWGYAAREIIEFLLQANYRWFAIGSSGELSPISTERPFYDENLVALPQERREEFQRLLL